MKIAIVGSRNFTDLPMVRRLVQNLPPDTTIISGGAKGVDTAAEHAAAEIGMPVRVFEPLWEKHGRAAGVLRNYDIIAAADLIVAFWDGESKGTAHTIKSAQAAGKPCLIVTTE